jgi:hypothetical protein
MVGAEAPWRRCGHAVVYRLSNIQTKLAVFVGYAAQRQFLIGGRDAMWFETTPPVMFKTL